MNQGDEYFRHLAVILPEVVPDNGDADLVVFLEKLGTDEATNDTLL